MALVHGIRGKIFQSAVPQLLRRCLRRNTTHSCVPFCSYIVAVCNDRIVHLFHPITGEEIVSFHSRAPVYCLSSGLNCKMAFGDACGNIYVVVLK